jgi:peptidoglycan/xylan/chitin deacetylase (PgdA/CDA1 family)
MNLSQLHRLATRTNIPPLLGTWRRLNDERPVSIVMYHSISPDAGPWTISPPAFERQIRFLKDTYRIIPLRNIAEALAAKDNLRHVVITFDDAYRNFVDHAHPVLESLEVACTMFVPTAHIGKSNQWDAEIEGFQKMEIMEAPQLRQIAESPQVDIGSHTIDHCRMGRLSVPEMRRQAADSRADLEHLLGREIVLFAYPWGQLGDFSNLSTRVLAETGYKAAVTTRWGTTNSMRQVLALRRISFGETDSIEDLQAKVEGDYDWFAMKEWVGYTKRRLSTGRT